LLDQYAAALATQVATKEITEGEARRRFAEYKTQQIQHQQQVMATIAAALAPAPAPTIVTVPPPVVVPPPPVFR